MSQSSDRKKYARFFVQNTAEQKVLDAVDKQINTVDKALEIFMAILFLGSSDQSA